MTETRTTHWKALREAAGLTQREAERRMGWTKRGHLSLIERGFFPTPEQEADMKHLYGSLILNANIAEVAKPA